MIHGQDWSSYQSATPSTAGLDFAFVKVTEGLTYVNPRWVQQRDHAKKAGLVWGAYHYPHMANDPIKEADYFLRQVAWKPGDVIVLDWEGYDSANKGVPKSRQLAYRDAWLKHVKGRMPGHRVGMYANTDYWLNVDRTSNCGDFLWIATAGRPAGSPGISHPWTFHQYSTAGGIDHDVAAFPSRAALAAWAKGSTPAPAPTPQQEDDMDPVDLWAYKHSPKLPADGGGDETEDAYAYLRTTRAAVKALTAQVGALSAAVAALARDGGLPLAQVQAAAEAGAKAALEQLADALKEA